MKLHTVLATTAVVALAAATVVVAQDKPQKEVRKVVMVVKDDGKGCNVEVQTFMRGPAFEDIDANKDGSISKAEFDAFHKDHHPADKMDMPPPPPPSCDDEHEGPGEHRRIMIRHMGDMDANKDGKVTFDEFTAPMKEHFAEMDKNHDGVLSGDELPKMRGDLPPPADH